MNPALVKDLQDVLVRHNLPEQMNLRPEALADILARQLQVTIDTVLTSRYWKHVQPGARVPALAESDE